MTLHRSIATLLLLCAAAHADPLPNPDPATYGEDPPAPPPRARSRVPDYIAATVTAGLSAATVVSFIRLVTTTDQRDGQSIVRDGTDAERWKVATLVCGSGAVLSGVVTAYLWARHRAPSFDVNASTTGAIVTYSGRF